ncbi:glycosyltransferase family 4 protein [Rhodobacteraceae bacterium KMM 6894]|nr:glycosyltransferase family 4 protein [Rhodobacteraceae bacterium KMM 6894]
MAKPRRKTCALLYGGDGGRSGVPRHLDQLCETLGGKIDLTIASDRNCGGYDGIIRAGATHVEIEGLRNSLKPARLLRGWRSAQRLAAARKWDMIWLHARLPALMIRLSLAVGLLRLAPQTRLVMSYHGIPFDPGHRRLAAWASRWIEKLLLHRCPPMHLVFLSEDMVIRLRSAVGSRALQRHEIHVLPNSSNLGNLPTRIETPMETERHLVITGRAGYQKNYPLAARLMDHMPQGYILTLCGTGTDSPAFQTSILGLVRSETRSRIRFAGSLADVRHVLAQADGYLLTSRYEGLPIGAIEAFESGLPLILSSFEAAPEMVAAHPMALCLPLKDLPRDAARISRLIEEYKTDRPACSARIRAAWRRKYPYTVWQARVRRLMSEIMAN